MVFVTQSMYTKNNMGDSIKTTSKRWHDKDAKSLDFFKRLDENKALDIPIDSELVEGVETF